MKNRPLPGHDTLPAHKVVEHPWLNRRNRCSKFGLSEAQPSMIALNVRDSQEKNDFNRYVCVLQFQRVQ